MIDWRVAETAARFVAARADAPPERLASDLGALCEAAQEHVREYTRLRSAMPPPSAETVERSEWIGVNLSELRSTMEPLAGSLRARLGAGPMGGALSRVGEGVLGVEVGGMVGYFSTRVLAQYQVALLDPEAPPRLLFVRPNLLAAQRRLAATDRDLLMWIAIHEVTHAFQFGSCTWLRAELGQVLERYLASMGERLEELSISHVLAALRDPRQLLRRLREGSLLEVGLEPEQSELVERAQAIMTLVEGHAEHVMHHVGRSMLPSYPRLARLEVERRRRSAPERLLQRLLGLDLKLRQYEQGKRFVDDVVAAGGIDLLNRVWGSPDAVPSLAEIAAPQRWIERVSVDSL